MTWLTGDIESGVLIPLPVDPETGDCVSLERHLAALVDAIQHHRRADDGVSAALIALTAVVLEVRGRLDRLERAGRPKRRGKHD